MAASYLFTWLNLWLLFFFLNPKDLAETSEGIIFNKHAGLSESMITAACVFTLLNHA